METHRTREPDVGARAGWWNSQRSGAPVGTEDIPQADAGPGRSGADWGVVASTFLIGLGEAMSPGLGWPWLRLTAAAAIAWFLLRRRTAPLLSLVGVVAVNLVANVALRAAGHFVLVSGVMLIVAVYALVRWASGRDLILGLVLVAAHMVVGSFVNPNWSAVGALLFYGSPVLVALAARPGAHSGTTTRRPSGSIGVSRELRIAGALLVVGALSLVSGGGFLVDQLHSYITRARSPAMPAEWAVDAATLRRAAEASRGIHGPDGAIIHTVDYPHELLSALDGPTYSVEADVTVIDGEGFLQHDPKDPVGIRLIEFLEYAAIAEFPIVKLDLKRDRVGPVMDDVREAVDQFGLDPAHVHFNADVFRGPAVDENFLGARTDLSFTDAMYNLIVMELEPSDLVRIAERFPESTIVISSTPPKGPQDVGYSEHHLDRYVLVVDEVRAVNPSQPIVFAVRGDLAARSGPFLLEGFHAVDDSSVAAWWSQDVPPTGAEIEVLRAGGVTFFDLGSHVEE